MVANRGPELQAVCSTMVSISFISVALRVWVRARIIKAFGWDDFFMVLALVSQPERLPLEYQTLTLPAVPCDVRNLCHWWRSLWHWAAYDRFE